MLIIILFAFLFLGFLAYLDHREAIAKTQAKKDKKKTNA